MSANVLIILETADLIALANVLVALATSHLSRCARTATWYLHRRESKLAWSRCAVSTGTHCIFTAIETCLRHEWACVFVRNWELIGIER